jgi:hypothetical protein
MFIDVVDKSGIKFLLNPHHVVAIVGSPDGSFALHFAQETSGGLRTLHLTDEGVHEFMEATGHRPPTPG